MFFMLCLAPSSRCSLTIPKLLNVEKKDTLVKYFTYMKLRLPVSNLNCNRKCQEDNENICSFYVEEIRFFCKFKVQESGFP